MQRMALSDILRNAVDFARPVLLSLMGTIMIDTSVAAAEWKADSGKDLLPAAAGIVYIARQGFLFLRFLRAAFRFVLPYGGETRGFKV